MTIEELREYNKGRRIFQIGIVVKNIDESVKKSTIRLFINMKNLLNLLFTMKAMAIGV